MAWKKPKETGWEGQTGVVREGQAHDDQDRQQEAGGAMLASEDPSAAVLRPPHLRRSVQREHDRQAQMSGKKARLLNATVTPGCWNCTGKGRRPPATHAKGILGNPENDVSGAALYA